MHAFPSTFESSFSDVESRDQIFGRHTTNTGPYPFVDSLGSWLIKALTNIDKPEGVDHSVVPEQEFNVFAKFGRIHFLKNF